MTLQRKRMHRALLGSLLILFGLLAGCNTTMRQGEKTLEVEGLTLAYRDKTTAGPEIAALNLQHPLKISEQEVGAHMQRLTYENYALLGESGRVFAPQDIKRMLRLLTKALNHALSQNVIAFELDSKGGTTAGLVFASGGHLHWRFEEIQGVKYSLTRNPGARYGTAWRLVPKKGQRYHLSDQLLGSRQWTNWVVARVDATAGDRRARTAPSGSAMEAATVPDAAEPLVPATPAQNPSPRPELEEKLKFLKHLYENQLIDEREYQKKRKELLDQLL